MMCGKLLKAVLGMYLASLREREDIPDEVCREVLGMSASTIDRRLRGDLLTLEMYWRASRPLSSVVVSSMSFPRPG